MRSAETSAEVVMLGISAGSTATEDTRDLYTRDLYTHERPRESRALVNR
jgi:hypothetical protein